MDRQERLRQKLIERVKREKQSYIAQYIGIPTQVLSSFKLGKKELWETSLSKLEDYLENH